MGRKQSELETYLEQHKDKFTYSAVLSHGQRVTVHNGWKCYAFTVTVNGVSLPYYVGTGYVELTTLGKRLNAKLDTRDDTVRVSVPGHYSPDTGLLWAVKAPSLGDVLSSLALDAEAESMSFEDWCDNFGYNTDSRKDLECYLSCQESGRKLRQILRGTGINADIIRAPEH